MAERDRPQIKDDDTYEALRENGESKEKAARIANARAAGRRPGRLGGRSKPYEQRSRDDLYEQARKVGIKGRSKMNKAELIQALRDH